MTISLRRFGRHKKPRASVECQALDIHLRRNRHSHGHNRRLVCLVVAILVAVAVAACGGSSGGTGTNSPSATSTTLNIGLAKGPASFDIALDGGGQQLIMRSLSNEALTHENLNGTFSPGLATSWHYIGSGNEAFEFTLRHDAKFSDGTPVNASAVSKWLKYYQKAGGPFAGLIALKSVQTIGNWTVKLTLSSPNPVLPLLLSGSESNWGLVSGPNSLNAKAMANTTDGAGPYMLQTSGTVQGSQYTYVPNPHYYDKSAVHYKKVVVKIISSPATMLEAIKTDQVQFAAGDTTTAAAASSAGLQVAKAPSGTAGLILLDRTGKNVPPLGNVKVRQALNYAINRNTITKGLVGNYGIPSSELLSTDGYDPSYQNYYPYNPKRAKALLAAAGYPHGFSFSDVDGTFFGTVGGDQVTQAVAQDLSAIGVKIKVSSFPTNGEYQPKAISGDYEATTIPWDGSPMWYDYALLLAPTAVVNPFHANDPELNKLFAEGSKAPAAEGAKDWIAMTQQFTKTAVFLPVFNYEFIYYAAPSLHGVAVSQHVLYPLASQWSPS